MSNNEGELTVNTEIAIDMLSDTVDELTKLVPELSLNELLTAMNVMCSEMVIAAEGDPDDYIESVRKLHTSVIETFGEQIIEARDALDKSKSKDLYVSKTVGEA